jgi:SAM-dependent methyltransferase
VELTHRLKERLRDLYLCFTFDLVAREPFDHLHFGLWRDVPHDPLRFAEAQQAYADAVVALIGPEHKRVLDVGCGLGSIARQLAERGHEVVAISPRADHVAQLRAVDGVRFEVHCARFEDLEPQGPVDLVLFAESFNFLAAQPSAVTPLLDRCAHWLDPRGQVLVADWLSAPVVDALAGDPRFAPRHQSDITAEVAFTFDALQQRFERVAKPYHELLMGVLEATDPELATRARQRLASVPNQALRGVFEGSLGDRATARDRRYLMMLLEHQPQSQSTSPA